MFHKTMLLLILLLLLLRRYSYYYYSYYYYYYYLALTPTYKLGVIARSNFCLEGKYMKNYVHITIWISPSYQQQIMILRAKKIVIFCEKNATCIHNESFNAKSHV